MACGQGDFATARSLLEESLILLREIDQKRYIPAALVHLALVAYWQGDYAAARPLLEESLVVARERRDKLAIANSLNNLGLLAYAQTAFVGARSLLEESLTLSRKSDDKLGTTMALLDMGALAMASAGSGGDAGLPGSEVGHESAGAERGARLLGAAEALLERMGTQLEPPNQQIWEQTIAVATARLGEAACAQAWAQGRALSLEQAIAYALGDTVA